MRTMFKCKKDCNAIQISGTQILEIDLNAGWTITEVVFDSDVPANEIDEIKVTFKKKYLATEE